MAVRTTAAKVKEILDTAQTDPAIEAYIAIASQMVDDLPTSLSEERLTEIERWLTAHFIASTKERMGKTEQVGEAQISYLGEFGKNLESTPYGQTAAMLDTSGTLNALGKKKAYFKTITSFE